MSKVTVKDNGWRGLLARAREASKGRTVKVGILEDQPKELPDGETSELSLIEVAIIHEFGAPERNIPQRSYLRATVDERAADIRKLLRVVATRLLKGELTVEQALDQVGAKVAAWVQLRIDQGIAPPLRPETVARKGSSKPLVNVGQLKAAITWLVGA